MASSSAAPVRAEHEVPVDRKRTLNVTKLVLIAFASVAGGPYGFEESVGAAGVKYTLLGLVCVPWIWSIPLALMTAELSSAMPENGGHILWVDRAFGSFWSYLNGEEDHLPIPHPSFHPPIPSHPTPPHPTPRSLKALRLNIHELGV